MPSNHPNRPVVTRFAPSPTGHLHIGGVRTALFCFAYARGREGLFLLRIEDTDRARSSESAARGILEDLAWLGIEWDEGPEYEMPGAEAAVGGDPRSVGPFYQSQRLDVYDRAFEQLLEAGRCYPAFESTEELGAMRAEARARKDTFHYRKPPDFDADAARARMAGEEHVLRLDMGTDPVTVNDSVLGEIEFTADHFDDFVIRKRDGFPTYHFAVVVDDESMGVTHVLRGQEHLNNTPRHVALQGALGFATPIYAHLPLIFNPDGSKMSKRDKDKAARAACKDRAIAVPPVDGIDAEVFARWLKDKTAQLPTDQLVALAGHLELELPEIDVEDFRRGGYLPEVICNYLALLGWNPGVKNDDGTDLERFDLAYLESHFDLDRVGKTASKFDRAKLLAFNADTIQKELSDEAFADRWRAWLARYEPQTLDKLGDRMSLAASAARPRARTLASAADPIRFALHSDDEIVYDPKAVKKVLLKEPAEGQPGPIVLLREVRDVLGSVEPFEPEAIETAIERFCDEHSLGMGKVAQPLRVAITGGTTSPGLGQTLALVGRASTLSRITRCIDAVHSLTKE